MPKFKIPVVWEMCDEFEVEAETIEDAIVEVQDNVDDKYNIEGMGEYIDDSFSVQEDCVYDMNGLVHPLDKPYDPKKEASSGERIVFGRVDQNGHLYGFESEQSPGEYGLNLKDGQVVDLSDGGQAKIKSVSTIIRTGEPNRGRPNWVDVELVLI